MDVQKSQDIVFYYIINKMNYNALNVNDSSSVFVIDFIDVKANGY